jgi:hypothetical protein
VTSDRAAVVLRGGLFGPHAPLLMYSADAGMYIEGPLARSAEVLGQVAPLSSGSSTTSYGLNGTGRPGTHEGARRSPIAGYDKVAAKLASSGSPVG